MKRYSLGHLSNQVLRHDLTVHAARVRGAEAVFLAHVAEFDARKLYRADGYSAMSEYCIKALRLSEDAAYKRITAARAAYRFPAIFDALADGRLHLSAVVLLSPHLTEGTADELLGAAARKTKSEIERLLAERFPQSEVLAWVGATPSQPPSPGQVATADPMQAQLAPGRVGGSQLVAESGAETRQHALGQVRSACRVRPLSSQSYEVQFTMDQDTHALLCEAQELLGHEVASGDVATVMKRGLQALVLRLRKTKFAATDRPRTGQRHPTAGKRHIPADVKRAVWERDGGQCTFVSDTGHRCEARKPLEFDHIEPFARGGEATVAGIRLRCRAHNQYEAERLFGAGFMNEKREAALRAAAHRRAAAGAESERGRGEAEAMAQAAASAEPASGALTEAAERARADAAAKAHAAAAAAEAAQRAKTNEVIPWLRGLGFRADEARAASALCESIPDAPLEHRVRVALSYFHRPRPGAARSGTSPAQPPSGSGLHPGL